MDLVEVTPETYIRAESDRSFRNIAKLAGGVNRFFHIRAPTPLDKQTIIRMNQDTLYSAVVVDTAKSATVTLPENGAFWSITVYGADGYMMSENAILNSSRAKLNPDGTFTAYFGSKELCGDVPNRMDVTPGWNFIFRVYRPWKSVLDGSYVLPPARPV